MGTDELDPLPLGADLVMMSHDRNDLESSDCPLCGSGGNPRFLKSRDFLYTKEEFSIARCAACGALYTDPRVKKEAIAKYYPSKYSLYGTEATAKSRFCGLRQTIGAVFGNPNLRILRRLRGSGAKKVLEIGPGDGALLELLRENDFEVVGIETNDECVRRLNDRGIKCLKADLNEAMAFLPVSSFDAVIMHHAFEHLYEPIRALRSISSLLMDHGLLLIALPDAGSWEARLFGQFWRGLDLPRHLVHYDRITIRKVVSDAGFGSIQVVPVAFPSSFVESIGFYLFGGRMPVSLYFMIFYPLKAVSWLTMHLVGSGAIEVSALKLVSPCQDGDKGK